MVNPVIETTCNSSSSQLNTNFMFYEIKLINLLGNEIISTNLGNEIISTNLSKPNKIIFNGILLIIW